MTKPRSRRTLRAAVLATLLALTIGGLGVGAAAADDDPSGAPSGTTSDAASDPGAPTTDGAGDGSSTGAGDAGDNGNGAGDGAGDNGSAADPGATGSEPPRTPSDKGAEPNYCAQLHACVRPSNGVYFNYPFSGSTNRYRLRNLITRMVNAVPGTRMANGHRNQIRIAQFSVNDNTLVNALIRAKKRGVSVQVVVDEHNVHGTKSFGSSPSFIRLTHALGGYRGTSSSYRDVSWARYCHKSCRGRGGDVHYKMVLISNVASGYNKSTGRNVLTPWVTVMGSPNLTLLAAQGQWNHQNIYVDRRADHPTYASYALMFNQMAQDRRQRQTYRYFTQGSLLTYFYPKGSTASTDPGMKFFNGVRCTGAASGYGNRGRTVIRIGQYAWYEPRGQWFAKRVRQLWNAGCDVAIETSVMGNTVKKILTSPRGRGRIPVRQIGTQDRHGKWLTYDHAKWVTISGNVSGNGRTVKVTQGTTNWSNLALASDDFMQVFTSYNNSNPAVRTMYHRFYDNFRAIWRGPRSRSLSPASRIPGDLGGPNAKLGQGKYSALEPG